MCRSAQILLLSSCFIEAPASCSTCCLFNHQSPKSPSTCFPSEPHGFQHASSALVHPLFNSIGSTSYCWSILVSLPCGEPLFRPLTQQVAKCIAVCVVNSSVAVTAPHAHNHHCYATTRKVILMCCRISNCHCCFIVRDPHQKSPLLSSLIALSKCCCRSLVSIAFAHSSTPPHGCRTHREPCDRNA